MGKYGYFILIVFFVMANVGTCLALLPDSYEGARPVGMGGAFAAVADDSDAMFYNPAGLAFLNGTNIDLTYGINSSGYLSAEDLNIAHSFGDLGCFGLGMSYWGIEQDSPIYSVFRNKDEFTYLLFSYSKAISDKLSVGGNYRSIDRFVQHGLIGPSVEEMRARGGGLDLGLLYKVSDELNIGVSAINLVNTGLTWDSGSMEAIFSKIKTGLAYKTLEDKLLLSMGVNYQNDEASFNLGGEYKALEWLFLRAGYNNEQDREGTLTIGLGLKGGIWGLDIAYLSGDEQTDYVSLNMNW